MDIDSEEERLDLTKYKEDMLLGEGGFGKVFLVSSKTKNKTKDRDELVVKEIYGKGLFFNSGFREINVMCSFDSNYLIKATDFFIEEDRVKIVMPVAQGSMEDRFDKYYKYPATRLTISEKLRMMKDVINGLYVLNKNGYYHCDIKPENILIMNNKMVLSDYSLVRLKGTLSTCGTVSYTSPENLKANIDVHYYKDDYDYYTIEKINHIVMNSKYFMDYNNNDGTDIWSLGVLICYILSNGNEIFYRKDPIRFINNMTDFFEEKDNYLNWFFNEWGVRNIPNKLYNLIKLMLNYNPNDRPTIEYIFDFFTIEFNMDDNDLGFLYSIEINELHDISKLRRLHGVVLYLHGLGKKLNMYIYILMFTYRLLYSCHEIMFSSNIDDNLFGLICLAIVYNTSYDKRLSKELTELLDKYTNIYRNIVSDILNNVSGEILIKNPYHLAKSKKALIRGYELLTDFGEYTSMTSKEINIQINKDLPETPSFNKINVKMNEIIGI